MIEDVAEARAVLKQIKGAKKHETWDSTFYRCTDGTDIELERVDAARDLLAINPNGAGRKPKYDWALIDTLIADGYHEHGMRNSKKLRGYVADNYRKRDGQFIPETQATLRDHVQTYLKRKEGQESAD